jgi:hypothetical protein
MEEKNYQNSEEENFSNYNYEEFVRIIKKEDVNTSPKPDKLDEIDFTKENQKENLINSIQSSEMTSMSLSQAENLSQTSDNIYIPNESKQNNLSPEIKIEEKNVDYFFGYENYFRELFPEKFDEYKTSRNYLPKKQRDPNKNQNYENSFSNSININETQNEFNNQEENKIDINNNFQFGNNFYYYPMNGNFFYYLYNNFYINYSNAQSSIPPEEIEKNSPKLDDNAIIKEEEIKKLNKNETEQKIDIKHENKNEKNDEEGEYENIYIIKRKNVRNNYNNNIKKKYIKQEKPERPNEKRNNKDYNFYNINNKNNYYYKNNNNDNYTKFNGNYDKRKRRFNYENNFYKKKYHKEIYY